MTDIVYDVIVCGAGPVGLFFAYQMIMQGHSVYICDQKEGPTEQSRAFFVTARSLEIFENKGIAHRLLQEAYVLRGAQLFVEGCESTSLEADAVGDTIFPQLTSIPQSKTESILASLIQEKTPIHWNTQFQSYTEDEHYVTAATLTKGKSITTIKGKFIIGSDGSHSTVRKQNPTWKYEGYSANTQFALADVVLSGPSLDAVKDKFNVFYHSDGMCLIIPINYNRNDRKNNLFRIIANKGPYEKQPTKDGDIITHGICDNDNGKLTLDQVNSILKSRADTLDLEASDPAWMTHFCINERKTNGYRRGKAFLVGDAAHCHSPIGGQGMNLGLQDADNLAWKMSLVLKGNASNPEILLDSYTTEREPIAKDVIIQTGNATELVMSVSFVMAILRYIVFSSAFSISKLKEYSMSGVLQLHLAIDRESPLIGKSDIGLIEPGKFLPETALLLKRSLSPGGSEHLLERKTLHQIISNTGKHTALWVGTRQATHKTCELISKFWSKVQRINYKNAIRPVIVESIWHVPEYKLSMEIQNEIERMKGNDTEKIAKITQQESENFWVEYQHPDASDSITSVVGLQSNLVNCTLSEPPAALIIIRPDFYIAQSILVQSEADIDRAFEFLNSYLK